MPSPVELTLTVTKFTANPSPTHPKKDRPNEHCEIKSEILMTGLTTGTGGWQIDPAGQVFICPPPDVATIAVKRTGADPVELVFKIDSAPGVPNLRPIAIVFEQQRFKHDPNKGLDDVDGSTNFKLKSALGNKLGVANHWVSRGKSKNRKQHQAPHWKFWIRVETTDANGQTLTGWMGLFIEGVQR